MRKQYRTPPTPDTFARLVIDRNGWPNVVKTYFCPVTVSPPIQLILNPPVKHNTLVECIQNRTESTSYRVSWVIGGVEDYCIAYLTKFGESYRIKEFAHIALYRNHAFTDELLTEYEVDDIEKINTKEFEVPPKNQ